MKLLGNDTTSTNSYASGNGSNAHFANSTYSGNFLIFSEAFFYKIAGLYSCFTITYIYLFLWF